MGPAPHTLEFTNQRGTQGKKHAITSNAGECSRGGRQPCSCLVGAKRKAFLLMRELKRHVKKWQFTRDTRKVLGAREPAHDQGQG